MRLLNTRALPPGGYTYVQPETGKKFGGMIPFNNLIAEVVSYRRGNKLPRSNATEVTQDLHDYNCVLLGNSSDYCTDGVVVVKKKPLMARMGEAAKHAAEAVENVATAAQVLNDWLGTGMEPVPQEVAQARSDICTGRINGNPCPKNRKQGFSFSMSVASAIQTQMQKKGDLGLKLEGENDLGTCEACGCFLKLKNWVPFHHIYAHTSDDQMSKFPNWCWLIKERKEQEQLIPA